ncbi:isoinhibitor K-like [Centruroides sculpturatus]|uniref:isoinhibitor K-like n=1 Tax=Centruroides sculpturatus TaxID=218467 RepID=UPI000C6E9B7A|nr:isoinhibitor K-like [Centruroides sculpturatus]XP_023217496.1 isoinhibitor K-like [Centruroides sculpturatus]
MNIKLASTIILILCMYSDAQGVDCNLPSETGPCKAAFRQYYHNSESGNCEIFIYGGCRGNSNRFVSLEECCSHCSAKNC